jgi:glycosyltransferase involved in cell wall biosynthesis
MNPLRVKKIDKFIKRFFIHPDDQIGWLPFAYFHAVNSIRKNNIKAIYSSSGPITCHLIAYLIKKRTGIPWVADFRDEWFEAPNHDMPTNLHRKFHFKIEKLVVKSTDKIVCMAPIFAKFLTKHTNQHHKFTTIPAGFDPDDVICEKDIDSKKFNLTFTGLFYNTFRPKGLLQAASDLIEEGKIAKEEIVIKFVGGNSLSDLNYEDKFKICEFTGFLPRKEAIRHAATSSVLLLLLSSDRGKDVIPSKIFEYLASGKTILAIVPSNGEVANIVRKTKSGIVADFGKVNEIKTAILELYSMWQKNELGKTRDIKDIEKYSQINLVKQLAEILQEITA